ncbi:MAG: hypothetical protein ACM3TN_19190 [Alphaproteobacteria bacterium]
MNKGMLSVGFAIALFWSSAIALAQEQAPAPSYKEGDTWQYKRDQKGQIVSSSERISGVFELVLSQGNVKVYEINGNEKTEVDVTPGGPGDGLSALVAHNEQRPILKYPLSVGQKWNYEYESTPAGARQTQKRSVEVVVAGIEQITTPAGTFKAYKLVRSEKWQGAGRRAAWNGNTTTYFYSPETRSVVKSSTVNDTTPGTSEIELIKFTPGS